MRFIYFSIVILFSGICNIFAENIAVYTEEKYLITNNSAGYFKIGGNWREFAKKYYYYDYVEGIVGCIDACCVGGYYLGKNIIVDKDGKKEIQDLEIIIEAEPVNKNMKIKKSNFFYIESDNCSEWYHKDKTDVIVIVSDLYKTVEGIGVGTSIETMKKKLGSIKVNIGWLEEDNDALFLTTDRYPNIKFVIDKFSYKGELESFREMKLSISMFKKNTVIEKIIIYKSNL